MVGQGAWLEPRLVIHNTPHALTEGESWGHPAGSKVTGIHFIPYVIQLTLLKANFQQRNNSIIILKARTRSI